MDTAAAECERQADGHREETEGEGEEERGEKNVGDMKICREARERESKAEPVKNAAVSCFSMRFSGDMYEIGMS